MSIRVGVVGVRFGATVHIPALQAEGVDVVAVCARRRERAEAAAAAFGIPHVVDDWKELIALDGIDAVSIATPVPLHFPISLAALSAGRHVLCEKPFTVDAAQARELFDVASRLGRTAMMGHEFRFTSARMRAKELIDSGYIGDLELAIVRVLFGRRPAQPAEYEELADEASTGAGLLCNQGSHYIDGLRHLFGEVTRVSGCEALTLVPDRVRAGERVLADAEDTFLATLHFAEGGRAQLTASRVFPFTADAGIEIYGSEGTLLTPQPTANPPYRGRLVGARVGDTALSELEIPARLTPFVDDRDDRMVPFRLLVREFLRGVEEGSSPAPSFYDGFRCQQVIDAIRRSSTARCDVEIPPG